MGATETNLETPKDGLPPQSIVQEAKRLTDYIEGQEKAIDWTGASEDTQYFSHGFHPYPARMPPHVSRRLLRMFSQSKSDALLDPYCGSGGVLVEGMLYDRRSIGVDLNPLAVLIARVKTRPISPGQLMKARSQLLMKIETLLKEPRRYPTPKIKNVSFWFKPKAIQGLSAIREALDELPEDSDIHDFFRVCLSLTVRKSSNIKNGEFKLYGKQGDELKNFEPKPIESFSRITLDNIVRMRGFFEEMQGHPRGSATVLKGDTRKLLEIDPSVLSEHKVKVVITSPPYGDSHTTVAYGQFSRYSSLWLGFPEEEVLTVDDSGLGGRILSEKQNLGSPTLDKVLSDIGQIDEHRAKEVYSFFYDADVCLDQIAMALVRGQSHCCYVVANRTVRRIKVPADIIFTELAENHGFKHMTTFYRDIPNKYIPHVNAPENIPGKLGATMTNESIVVWKY
jgi:site-specific DNA-methyltransferase (cytosine-N4-specific)